MNYIKHLSAVLESISGDTRLNTSHVSLYMALFQLWNQNRFENPVSINRMDTMRISKIGSRVTYHRCLKDLSEWNYFKYYPSHNPMKGSLIDMYIFETSSEPTCGTTTGLVVGQVLDPSINSINITNNKKNTSFYLPSIEEVIEEKAILLSTAEGSNAVNTEARSENPKRQGYNFNPPNFEEVKNYFLELESTVFEAEKYFNYYSSKGWVVGNKSPMKDWKAAARNWKMNVGKFISHSKSTGATSPSSGHLHINQDKDYNIPL